MSTPHGATRHAEIYRVLEERAAGLSVSDCATYRWLRALLDLAATLLDEHPSCVEEVCPIVRAVYTAIRDATAPGPTTEEGTDS